MKTQNPFTGLGVALVTPFTPEGAVDYTALRRLILQLRVRYPTARVVGHCDLDPRKPHCPGFPAAGEYG